MTNPAPGTPEWLDQGDEPVLEPHLPIVDPHLWPAGAPVAYALDDLLADLDAGHRVEQTVFIECNATYAPDDPSEMAPVSETTFVAGDAARDSKHRISGIVAHADLRSASLDAILDAHEEAGNGLFRGIRDALSRA